MIPVLYAANETNTATFGIGALPDCLRCEVTEERNGIYEAIIDYPITGTRFAEIRVDRLIKILPNETSDPQLFRVYKIGKPINGVATVYLEHISYALNGNPVIEWSVLNQNAAGAILAALNGAAFAHTFTPWSDISATATTAISEPTSVRAILGGTRGGILDTYGGEYEFDNYTVKLHASRGNDTDVVIEYGKNITDLKQEEAIDAVYTALMPYAKYTTTEVIGGVETEIEHTVTLTEKTIAAPSAAQYARGKALIRDFSGDFEQGTVVTETLLRAAANAYIESNPIDVPAVNITVSFAQLWQTEEYKTIAPLERVKLCDTVTVRFRELGVDATAKIIKTTYDALLERYKSVEIGSAKSNFAKTLNNQQEQIAALHANVKQQSSVLRQAIMNATALITGQAGGYVVLNPPENPQEILIMNTPDINTATKVWRWNSGGLGYSSTGYNGDFGLAMTMDGQIVADFITAGTINGALLGAGSVVADAIAAGSITAEKIVVGAADKNYITQWELSNWVDSTYATASEMVTLTDSPVGGITQARRVYAQTSTAHTIYQPSSEQFEIAKGETYAFEGYYKASVDGLTFTASFSERNTSDGDASGNFLHSGLITTVTGGWKKFSAKLTVPSAWTELMCRAYMYVRIRTGAPTSGTIDFTGVSVKKTQTAAIITDGRIESVDKNTYFDLGTGEMSVDGSANKLVLYDALIGGSVDVQGVFWTPASTNVFPWKTTSGVITDTDARIYYMDGAGYKQLVLSSRYDLRIQVGGEQKIEFQVGSSTKAYIDKDGLHT